MEGRAVASEDQRGIAKTLTTMILVGISAVFVWVGHLLLFVLGEKMLEYNGLLPPMWGTMNIWLLLSIATVMSLPAIVFLAASMVRRANMGEELSDHPGTAAPEPPGAQPERQTAEGQPPEQPPPSTGLPPSTRPPPPAVRSR